MSKGNQKFMQKRNINNPRIRSNSADTKLIKRSFISSYRELCGHGHSGPYESNQINLKRFQLIRIIDNISASYTSWRDLINQQISLHYQLYPILENIRNPNSNQGGSPYIQKLSSDYQNSQNSSDMSNTPLTYEESNSIETAENLIKILLKKQHDIPDFFKWQWIGLFGEIYEQKQMMDLCSKNYNSLKQQIILSHIIGLNIKQIENFPQNKSYQNSCPLLLVLYQNSNFKENQKQTLFKKIINKIAFIRFLQISKLKSKTTLSSLQFQFNSNHNQFKKQRLQKITLINKRPIQFFIVISKTESIKKLKQKFESFYLNTLNLISTQHNVTFIFLITDKAWQPNNIQEIVSKKFIKKQNRKKQSQLDEADESDEEGNEENKYLNRGILDIEMSDDYESQFYSSLMSDDYEDVLNLIGQNIKVNKEYDNVPQSCFKKKKQAYISENNDEILASNNILDYIMKGCEQNQENEENEEKEEKQEKEQKEENHFNDKFLQLIMNKSKENKIYYQTVHNEDEESEDMDFINSLSKKQFKNVQQLKQEKQEKQKQQNIQEQ